jgi:large subunit ribosomal protein L29
MKKKKTADKKANFKDDSVAELTVKSRDLKQEIFNLRLQQASGQLEKPSRVRKLRKDVARIETQISVLRNKKAA